MLMMGVHASGAIGKLRNIQERGSTTGAGEIRAGEGCLLMTTWRKSGGKQFCERVRDRMRVNESAQHGKPLK